MQTAKTHAAPQAGDAARLGASGRASSSDPAGRFANIVLDARRLILGALVVIAVGAASGLQFLGLTTDNRVFFGPDNPQLLAFEAFEKIYTESNGVLVVLAPDSGDVFTHETLAAVEEFTAAAWKLPFAQRVDSVTNFPHSYAEDDTVVVEELVRGAREASDAELERVRDIALNEPLLMRRLVSESGHVTAIAVNFLLPEDDPGANDRIYEALRTAVDEVSARFPSMQVYLTGDIVLGATIGKATDDDVSLLVPTMFLLIFLVIGALLRSVSITIATVTVIVLAALTAMGVAGWLGYILNSGSAIAPTIILTIAIADSVHIVSNMLDAMRRGLPKRDAIVESLRINLLPVTLTSVTTTAGFLALNFSDSPPFHDLGNLVAIGIASAFVYSVTILPALLMVMPVKVRKRDQGTRRVERLGDQVIRRRRVLLWTMLGVVGLSVAGLQRIELTDDWVKYFDERYRFRTDTDFIIANLTGIETVEFSLPAAAPGGINDPEFLATVEAFAQWLREQPHVDHVFSLTDIFKRLNKNMHADDPAQYALPASDDLAAQYLLLYELSLPYGQALTDRIDVARSQVRLSATGDLTSTELRALQDDARQWLTQNAPAYMVTEPTGMSSMFAHISERNIETMLFGSALLLAAISGVLMVTFRSLRYGLVSLVPNLIPAAMAVGLWGWVFGELGMAVSVVGAMTLGIIVDDTIHFMVKYLKARRELSLGSTESVRYVFRVVGEPLYITTLALVAGFGVLALSGFQVNWAMGLLSATTIGVALIADFFLLPPLLLALDGEPDAATA